MRKDISSDYMQSISPSALRRYAQMLGYVERGQWGQFLVRFVKKNRGSEIELLIPNSANISDYDRRVYDFISAIADYHKKSSSEIFREIANSEFQIVRIVANEGSKEHTLSFDAAVDLLQNGISLIDASATIAVNGPGVGHIRGRRPDLVRNYLDRVRIGQTEIGSFVFNILMPAALSDDEFALAGGADSELSGSVVQTFRRALDLASKIGRHVEFSDEYAIRQGLTSNFVDGLVGMIGSVEALSIGVGPHITNDERRPAYVRTFTKENKAVLGAVSRRLKPISVNSDQTLSGTIIRIFEPSKKASGSFVLEADVDGYSRPVRVPFERNQRDVVIRGFQDKAMSTILVRGDLVDRGGQLRMERIRSIELSRRELLT